LLCLNGWQFQLVSLPVGADATKRKKMSSCSLCGAQFDCAMADPCNPDIPCWCTLLPAAISLPSAAGSACWCRTCLQQKIEQQIALQQACRPEPG
jgi:hypothetical protein